MRKITDPFSARQVSEKEKTRASQSPSRHNPSDLGTSTKYHLLKAHHLSWHYLGAKPFMDFWVTFKIQTIAQDLQLCLIISVVIWLKDNLEERKIVKRGRKGSRNYKGRSWGSMKEVSKKKRNFKKHKYKAK